MNVEGKVQRKGEVVHVIDRRCFDLSKLLRQLVLPEREDMPLLTLSRSDEKSAPYRTENKRTHVHQRVQMEILPAGRNFK